MSKNNYLRPEFPEGLFSSLPGRPAQPVAVDQSDRKAARMKQLSTL